MKSYPVRDYNKPLEGSLLKFFFSESQESWCDASFKKFEPIPRVFLIKSLAKISKDVCKPMLEKYEKHSQLDVYKLFKRFSPRFWLVSPNHQQKSSKFPTIWSRRPCRLCRHTLQENAEFQKVIAEQRQTQKLLKEAFLGCCWMMSFLKLFATNVFFCDIRCYGIHTSILSIHL